jgi:hypothetical protein
VNRHDESERRGRKLWPDNETSVDLLGFDYLVDSLEVVLTAPRLLPVTVGVLGDWGSGKSSLLRMVEDRLKSSTDYVVVSFSPWRYEAYEDVKAALMDAILDQLADRVSGAVDHEYAAGLLVRLRQKVVRMMAGPAAAGRVLAPVVGSIAAAHQGLSPEVGAAAGSALVAGIGAAEAQSNLTHSVQENHRTVIESVSAFREEFENLINSLDDVKAVIVLIDDLDRCLDHTVIDVFEAIRLFLQVSSTAFVIAANREIVQAAVERRYPSRVVGDQALGKDYLEKIIQVEITVPPLAEPEAETYLNLLFAELRLEGADMNAILSEAAKRRQQNQLSVAMNYGIAKDVLDKVPSELEADFSIANQIAPTLSRGLRGNPRQLKRFLNTMLLRLETARRRGVTLNPAVLAKLMVLEQHTMEFQQLFYWQLQQDGAPDELAVAESCVSLGTVPQAETSTELKTWFSSSAVRQWLGLEPKLAGVPLGQYFFFSRDRLSPAAPGARLSAPLQALLGRLQLPTIAQRRTAVQEAAKLGPEEFAFIYEAILERAKRQPNGEGMDSVVELTGEVPSNWPSLATAIASIPAKSVPIKLPAKLALVGGGRPEVEGLLDQWSKSTASNLKKAVGEVRKVPT